MMCADAGLASLAARIRDLAGPTGPELAESAARPGCLALSETAYEVLAARIEKLAVDLLENDELRLDPEEAQIVQAAIQRTLLPELYLSRNPPHATNAAPGRHAKITALMRRATLGYSLLHPADRRPGVASPPREWMLCYRLRASDRNEAVREAQGLLHFKSKREALPALASIEAV